MRRDREERPPRDIDSAESIASGPSSVEPALATNEITDEYVAAHAEIPVVAPSGGDFHAVFQVQDGSGDIGVVVGDVAGHGPSKTPQAEQMRDLLTDCLEVGLSPAETLDAVNALVEPDPHFEGFGTAFVSKIEAGTGKVTYASSGHEPALLASPQTDGPSSVEELNSTGPPLGVVRTEIADFTEQHAHMPEGSTLLVYTDGVSDARPPEDRSRFFGVQGIKQALTRYKGLPVRQVVASILARVIAFCRGRFHDDAAIVAVERRPKPRGKST